MKKILSLILCLCMTVTAFASNTDKYQYNYEELGVTIVFDEESTSTNEERQYLADLLVYGDSGTENSTTYSMCWLTGHDIKSQAVSEVRHKVSSKAPRCYQTIYEVKTCSKCDYVETTKLASSYIDCCPED